MKIKQLSIFMENRVGVLNEVVAILGDAGVNMRAFSVSDGMEFGILRLIVSEVERATAVLREADFKVNITDVLCIHMPNDAGSLSGVLDCLASENVFIQYMYAFSDGEVASTVIRPNDIDRCIEVLESNKERLTALNPLYSF